MDILDTNKGREKHAMAAAAPTHWHEPDRPSASYIGRYTVDSVRSDYYGPTIRPNFRAGYTSLEGKNPLISEGVRA